MSKAIGNHHHKAATTIASSAVHAADSLDISGIFMMTGVESFKHIFEHSARYFMLPFAAASTVMLAILSWRQARLHEYNGYMVARAIIETLGSIAITTAVTCALIFTTAFAIAGPAIFAATFGIKTLFNAGSAIYFAVKYYRESDPQQAAVYRHKIKDTLTATLVGVMATAAIIAVMFLAQPAIAIFGVAAGAIGAAASIAKCIELANEMNDKSDNKLRNTNNTRLIQKLIGSSENYTSSQFDVPATTLEEANASSAVAANTSNPTNSFKVKFG